MCSSMRTLDGSIGVVAPAARCACILLLLQLLHALLQRVWWRTRRDAPAYYFCCSCRMLCCRGCGGARGEMRLHTTIKGTY